MAEADAIASGEPEARVVADLPCYRCGYNLRSLLRGGDCPECGYRVEYSIGLGATRRWPLTAENACGWIAIGMLTLWLCGAGLLLWVIGVIILAVHLPKDRAWNKAIVWAAALSAVGLAAMVVLYDLGLGYPSSIFFLVIACLVAHYVAVMLMAIRIARDADMPVAYYTGWGLMLMPLLGFPVAILFMAQHDDRWTIAGVLIIAMWMFAGGLYWMGLSGELGSHRHMLMKAAKAGPYQRSAATDPPSHD